jgi:uncharacterized protein (DUF1501 family)
MEVSMDRRDFLRTMCAGGVATFGFPVVSFARVRQSGRLVFVLLRGGFDGLAAVVPYGDPRYRALRGALAFEGADLAVLNDAFGLAPGLAPLRELWDAGELAVLHAMAIPFRTRSHFDGQAILETGLDRPIGASDGWLNRLLQVMPGERSGIANRADGTLHGRFEAALQQQEQVGEEAMAGGGARRGGVTPLLRAAARILRQSTGPNVAAVEFSGWDTHANQGLAGGALDRLLGQLAEGLVAFRGEMGPAWADTTVVVMTEFGRTARPNGSRGTDHGTAGAGFLLGPKVARSTVLADWPGLGDAALYEGRDLRPTLDTRAVLKGAVAATFDLTAAQADRVFPGSDGVRGRYDLMR